MIEVKIDKNDARVTCKGNPIGTLAESVCLVQEAFRLAKTIAGGEMYDDFKAVVLSYLLDGSFDEFANEKPTNSTVISFRVPTPDASDDTEEGEN